MGAWEMSGEIKACLQQQTRIIKARGVGAVAGGAQWAGESQSAHLVVRPARGQQGPGERPAGPHEREHARVSGRDHALDGALHAGAVRRVAQPEDAQLAAQGHRDGLLRAALRDGERPPERCHAADNAGLVVG